MLIDNEKEFDLWLEQSMEEDLLAIDTEFLREKTYYPKLCLLQCATLKSKVALCPFSLDLKKLIPLLNDEKRTIIFHSADQDLEILQQELGTLPARLFDTQVAASFLGFGEQIGYAALVARVYSKKLDKSYTRFDWSVRPLPEKAMSYALNDVRYLIPLYFNLSKALEKKGRLSWNAEENALVLSAQLQSNKSLSVWKKVKGLKKLKGKKRAYGKKLATLREEQAMKTNRPRRWVFSDELLLDILTFSPKDIGELLKMKRFPDKSHRLAELIIQVLKEKVEISQDDNSSVNYSDLQQLEADYLMVFVRKIALDFDISTQLLLLKSDLLKWCAGDQNLAFLKGWRGELLAVELEAVKNGALVQMSKGQLKVRKNIS